MDNIKSRSDKSKTVVKVIVILDVLVKNDVKIKVWHHVYCLLEVNLRLRCVLQPFDLFIRKPEIQCIETN